MSNEKEFTALQREQIRELVRDYLAWEKANPVKELDIAALLGEEDGKYDWPEVPIDVPEIYYR